MTVMIALNRQVSLLSVQRWPHALGMLDVYCSSIGTLEAARRKLDL